MKLFLLLIVSILISINCAAETADILLQKKLTLVTKNLDSVIQKTDDNIKAFVDHFQIKLDSNSKITSQKIVTGTLLQPVLKVSIRKCVLFICQTIDLDAEFTLTSLNGPCQYNYLLSADLQRSSQILTDLYTRIDTNICITKTTSGGFANLSVNLVRSDSYKKSLVQKQAFGLISLQGQSIADSFTELLKLNGIEQIF